MTATEEVYNTTKQTLPKLVTEENNTSLCFIGRLNKAKNKICAKNKDDIEACILHFIWF